MDTMTWSIILAVCGGLLTIMNFAEKLIKAGKAINAPNEEQNRRIAALEERCDRYDGYFSSDKQRIQDLEQSLAVLMQGNFALLSHAIDGNNTEKLKKTRDEMLEYLTKRGIQV